MRIHQITLLVLLIFNTLTSQSQNANISAGLVFDGEPYLVVNPSNTNHLVVAWMGFQLGQNLVIKTKTSFDGGNSWSSSISIPHIGAGHTSADPSLAFDHIGDLFLCFVDYNPTTGSAGSVEVVKSSDGGLSWGAATEVISISDDPGKLCIDRPWMVIDREPGTHQGNIYVTVMNAKLFPVAPPYNPYFIKSTDGGTSFSTPRYLDTINYLAGDLIPQPMPSPSVSQNGDFYAVYPSYKTSQSFLPQLFVAKSNSNLDGFSHSTLIAGTNTAADSLSKKAGLLLCDPSDNSHLVYFMLLDNFGDSDVYMMESSDEAANWTTGVRVNDDPTGNGKMQDLVWANFDTDGDLAVCWRDRRNGGSGYETDSEIMCAIKCADSSNFTNNFVISDLLVSHDTVLNGSGNDFMSVQFQNDTLSAVWGDVRNGRVNVYFNRSIKDQVISISEIVQDEMPSLLFPNPSNGTIEIKEINTPFTFNIIDIEGKLVKTGTSENQIINTGLDSGMYFIQVQTSVSERVYRFIIN
jgi:hypothetical protein